MNQRLKISLNHFQWEGFAGAIQTVFENAPIAGSECESCLLADLYEKKMPAFTYFKPNKKRKMNFSFTLAQAFAINKVLSKHDEFYCLYVRMDLEKQLPASTREIEFKQVKLLEL